MSGDLFKIGYIGEAVGQRRGLGCLLGPLMLIFLFLNFILKILNQVLRVQGPLVKGGTAMYMPVHVPSASFSCRSTNGRIRQQVYMAPKHSGNNRKLRSRQSEGLANQPIRRLNQWANV